ncbi:MAG: hypothetical protein R3F62_20825 [Planctomycetota bacterium]
MPEHDPDYEADLPTGAYEALPEDPPPPDPEDALPPSQLMTGAHPALQDPRTAPTIQSDPPQLDPRTAPTIQSDPPQLDPATTPTVHTPPPPVGAPTQTSLGVTADAPESRTALAPHEVDTVLTPPRATAAPGYDVASAPTIVPATPAPRRSWAGWVLTLAFLGAVGALGYRAWREQRARELAPRAILTHPEPGTWVDGDVRIRGTVELTGARLELAGQAIDLGDGTEFEFLLGGLPDGVHTYTLKISGLVDGTRVEGTQPVVVRVDRTPPEVVIASPSEDGLLPNPPRLELRVRDSSKVQISVRGAARLNQAVEPGAGWALLSLPLTLEPGPHEVLLSAMDEAGHAVEVVRRFRVAPPDEPPAPPPPTEAPRITFGFAPDALLGAGVLPIQVAGAEHVEVRVDKHPLEAPYRLTAELADGSHELKVRAGSGLFEVVRTSTFRFDGRPPALELQVPASARSPLTLEGRLLDADPAARATLAIDGAAPQPLTFPVELLLTPGEHSLVIATEDTAGNTATHRHTVRIEATAPPPPPVEPPQPPPFVPADWIEPLPATSSTRLTVRGRVPRGIEAVVFVDGAARARSMTLPLVVNLLPGTRSVEVRAERQGAAAQVVARGTVEVDSRAPEVLTLEVTPVREGWVQVAGRVRESGFGEVTTQLLVNGQLKPGSLPQTLPLRRGLNTFLLQVYDERGRKHEATERVTYEPTLVIPKPEVEQLPGSWGQVELPQISGTLVEVRGTLNYAGLNVLVREGGEVLGESATLPFAVRVEPAGREHRLTVVAVDRSGRQQQLLERAVLISDREPVIRSVKLEPSGHDKGQVTVDAILQGQGRVRLTVTHNGRPIDPARPIPLAPGYNLIKARVSDDAGRESQLRIVARFFPATRTSTPLLLARPETGRPGELRAVDAYFEADYREALGELKEVLKGASSPVDPLVLRAASYLRLAQPMLEGIARTQQLTEAKTAIDTAIRNAGSQRVRADHYELQAQILEDLGRPTEAEQARNQANRLR